MIRITMLVGAAMLLLFSRGADAVLAECYYEPYIFLSYTVTALYWSDSSERLFQGNLYGFTVVSDPVPPTQDIAWRGVNVPKPQNADAWIYVALVSGDTGFTYRIDGAGTFTTLMNEDYCNAQGPFIP